MADKKKLTKVQIAVIIRNEFAFGPEKRAASLLYAEGVGSTEVLSNYRLPDTQRVAVGNELWDIERRLKKVADGD